MRPARHPAHRRQASMGWSAATATALLLLLAKHGGHAQRDPPATGRRATVTRLRSHAVSSNNAQHAANGNGTLLESQIGMLTSRQQRRLDAITAGSVGRDKVELVLARYNEDVSWARMYANILTVYNKGDTAVHIDAKPAAARGARVVDVPNVGREAHSLLHHIVHNYDKNATSTRARAHDGWPGLAEVTVFAHGGPPVRGYSGPESKGGHMYGNVSLHDYVLHDDARFVFTSAMRLTDATHIVRSGYNTGTVDRDQALAMCPPQSLDVPGSYELRFKFCEPNTALFACKIIGTLCRDEGVTEAINFPDSSLPGLCSPLGFWQRWVQLPRPRNDVIFFAQGAVFSFTRDQVRKRPKTYYESLLRVAQGAEFNVQPQSAGPKERQIYSSNGQSGASAGASAGFFLEWFWYYILTSSAPDCPVSGAEFDFATVIDFTRIPGTK